MNYKSMSTSMTLNLKRLYSDELDLIDPIMYHKFIGSLMYLVNTRPDICFVVSTLSQYMGEPRQIHWVATKHVLRYLHGTIVYGLWYLADSDMHLVGYIYLDWAGCVQDQKSTSRYCFSLGFVVIFWFSRKQTSVALCSVEAEYIATCMAAREAVWL